MRTNIRRTVGLLGALVGCLLSLTVPVDTPADAATKQQPKVTLSRSEAGAGATVTARGTGWRPETLLTLLVCGQNAIGGTNACANAEGRAVTTDGEGRFRKKIPVAEPPKPCPCVVRATTVTGDHAAANAKLRVAGHPVEPLPAKRAGGRLSVLAARLEGDSGLLNWFGAPEQRKLVLTVGNLGADRARDPVFEVGTSHGVLAPEWERQQWRGTIDPGEKARVELTVELASGAHGEYTVAAKLGKRVLTEQPWDVGRPWGVTLFWVLLCVVVPLAAFRLGMALVARVAPFSQRSARTGSPGEGPTSGTLPWFAPDTARAALSDDSAPASRRGGASPATAGDTPARTESGGGGGDEDGDGPGASRPQAGGGAATR
ncbi:neocarzinostatin apoprotein domain-containing protein [Streptomyces smyrnaeus]|uniref:neocarzinostatin apoprotein domain-containing protein n=1 Tax=Streptomyces smyrnaeus TaxID=1387713 RepID=UPI0036CEA58A